MHILIYRLSSIVGLHHYTYYIPQTEANRRLDVIVINAVKLVHDTLEFYQSVNSLIKLNKKNNSLELNSKSPYSSI